MPITPRHFLLASIAAPLLLLAPQIAAKTPPKPAHNSTQNTADPLFTHPYVDQDEWRSAPFRHRYVHGGFTGTDTKFSFYFPDFSQYQGRFFQYITPVPDSETLSQGLTGANDRIGFALTSGAYFIETNGGGTSATAGPAFGADPTIGGFRANAAAARYSRIVAMQMYAKTAHAKRPFGYAYGGSGGAFRTIGGMENTTGVWDGAVPFVIGSPVAAPNVFAVRMHAMRLLWDKFPDIIDAVEPGGSGDPYATLNVDQRQALAEVTRMGFPIGGWTGYKTMGIHAFSALYQGMVMADPGYFKDFWTKPGYLGFNPPDSLSKARLQFPTSITAAITKTDAERIQLPLERLAGAPRGTADQAWTAVGGTNENRPIAFRISGTPPEVGFLGGDLVIKTGAAAGKSLALIKIIGDVAILGITNPKTLAMLKVGDEVEVDNSNFLAAQTYHRHQNPGPQFPVWDQFRDFMGKPIYPQRKIQLGPLFAAGAGGGVVQKGKFTGKMIVVESLYDREAFAWQADWYRQRVRENLGTKTDSHFRLWITDRALHSDATDQADSTQTVSYLGDLQQALRDVAAWVEKGTPPPATTGYTIQNGQTILAANAAQRHGIQPVIQLLANGGKRADVKVGDVVIFSASITAPSGGGRVVSAEWDFDGSGSFAETSDMLSGQSTATVTASHKFATAGTYFVTFRGTTQRQGDAKTPFARLPNLDRVRVVVR